MSKIDFTQRNIGIDLFRSLTMFVMIFVNDFWKIHDVPHWLEHAHFSEDFMGLADVVFPCFLFIVGMAIPYGIERKFSKGVDGVSIVGHILSRTFALLIMGAFITNSEARLSPDVSYSIGVYWILMVIAFFLIWNQYPKTQNKNYELLYTSLKFIGVIILFCLAITFRDSRGNLFSARWGILGSIGWSYLLCSMIYLFTRDRFKYLIPLWFVFVFICILGSPMREVYGGKAILQLPRPNFYNDMLDLLHIGNGALPAFVMGGLILSLISVKYKSISGSKKVFYTFFLVGLFFLLGFVSREFWILSKVRATPPWVFYVIGIAIFIYAGLTWLVNRGWTSWLNIIKPAGTAALTCYLIPYVSYGLADITGIVLPDWFTHHPWGLINSFCFALIIIGVTWLLGKLHIKLKI